MSIQYIEGIQDQVDQNMMIKYLRSVLAAELIRAHTYYTESKVVQGVYTEEIQKMLSDQLEEERGHIAMIISRILQLGGNPEIDPMDWNKHTPCKYVHHAAWDEETILENALAGEKCVQQAYTKIAEFAKDRDVTSHHVLLKILDTEMEGIRLITQMLETVRGDDVRKEREEAKAKSKDK